jgi:hypothetical protein
MAEIAEPRALASAKRAPGSQAGRSGQGNYHSVARCTLLGEMIEDTATRYYYRPHVGGELIFVDKSPAIHLTPCPACQDWPASQQRGTAVRTNSR